MGCCHFKLARAENSSSAENSAAGTPTDSREIVLRNGGRLRHGENQENELHNAAFPPNLFGFSFPNGIKRFFQSLSNIVYLKRSINGYLRKTQLNGCGVIIEKIEENEFYSELANMYAHLGINQGTSSLKIEEIGESEYSSELANYTRTGETASDLIIKEVVVIAAENQVKESEEKSIENDPSHITTVSIGCRSTLTLPRSDRMMREKEKRKVKWQDEQMLTNNIENQKTSDRAQNLLHMKWRDEIESYMREMCVGKSSDDESSPDEDVVSSGMSLVTRTDEMMGRMEQKVREKSMFKNSSRSRGSSSMEEKACEFVEETYPNLVQRELLGSSKKGGPSHQTAAVNSDGRSASMASLSDTNEMVRGKGKKKVKWQGEQKVLTNVLEKQEMSDLAQSVRVRKEIEIESSMRGTCGGKSRNDEVPSSEDGVSSGVAIENGKDEMMGETKMKEIPRKDRLKRTIGFRFQRSSDMEDITVGGTLDEMNKTIGNISERLVSEKLQWSSTEDGPSYQENVRSNSRSDLMLSLDDGMKKKKGKRKIKCKDKHIKTKDTRKEVASSDMAERMLRKELEQEIANENYIRKMYRRRWSRNAHQDKVNSVETKCEGDVILEDFDDTIEPSTDRSWQNGRSVTAPSDRPGTRNVGPIPLRLAWSYDTMKEEREVGKHEKMKETPTSARDAATSESDVSPYWPYREWMENGSLNRKEITPGRQVHTKKRKRWNIATRLRKRWKRRRPSVAPAPVPEIIEERYDVEAVDVDGVQNNREDDSQAHHASILISPASPPLLLPPCCRPFYVSINYETTNLVSRANLKQSRANLEQCTSDYLNRYNDCGT
ncbi:uncharacterized protein LOC134185293 [Corticium candelabrum]|uniref:uncharacterized protein LOC134185293 n=1 Tax=Corticium candelabrum TaxID=121492 RepID=UPI002E2760AA|nr:uncharacterized protein LOC134185293 [Corticium candelabrum]